MPSSARILARMDDRTARLSSELSRFVQVFEGAERFTGPSLHFHRRTIDLLRILASSAVAVDSDSFVELLYATLTSWGMHRMGPGSTKLRDFAEVIASLRANRDDIAALEGIRLCEIPSDRLDVVAGQVWALVSKLCISIADAKIVANSKALHHVLPNLVPPIDRTYTFIFFYDRKELSVTEEDAFREMFSRFHRIAVTNAAALPGLVGAGWNTSETKVLDNAIVGYAIDEFGVQP